MYLSHHIQPHPCHCVMAKRKKDSDDESQFPPLAANLELMIKNPDSINSLSHKECHDLISLCSTVKDKRTAPRFLEVIKAAADRMQLLHEQETNNFNSPNESIELLKEIKNKLDSPNVPYNRVISSPSLKIPTTKEKEISLFISTKNNNTAPDQLTSEIYKQIQTFREHKPQLKVNKIIKYNKGNIVKLPKSEDLDELISFFKTQDKITKDYNVYIPKPRDPTIVLKRVNKLTSAKDIPKIISSINDSLKNCENEIKVLFEIGSFSQSRDIVLRVSPNVYQTLSNQKYIYTDMEAIQFQHRVFVKQCKFCFQFNTHKSNDCPIKNNPICVDCGLSGPHNCTKINKCINCTNYHKHNLNSHNCLHKPNNNDCPLFKIQYDRILEQTAFSPQDSIFKDHYLLSQTQN